LRLFVTPASPWVRRVTVSIIELGLQDRVQLVQTRWPHRWATQTVDYMPEFLDATPVARIPALVTDEGLRLADSGVICDYLNAEFGGYKLLPQAGSGRWEQLATISIVNGLLEAQIARRAESLRDASERSSDFIRKMRDREARCFLALEPAARSFVADVDLAQISVAAACGYADFRFPSDDWRRASPTLARWFDRFSERPSMRLTMPRETPQ
jgi:glutathione S-transferase